MNLHEFPSEFSELISLTSRTLGIEEIYVEKDYFVILALRSLATSPFRANAVFKGGTSLSKAYGIINRFSEDIDLAIINDAGNAIGPRALAKKVELALTSSPVFREVASHERVNKKGARLRQLVYQYPLLNPEKDFGQAAKHLYLDLSRMSTGIPFEEKTIRSYIHDFLNQTHQHTVISEFGLEPFSTLTLCKRRTFVEKLGITVKFAFLDEADGGAVFSRLTGGIRHIYDLHMLLQQPEIRSFMLDGAEFRQQNFNAFWRQVLTDDLHGNKEKPGYAAYMNSNFADCILYRSPEKSWKKLRPTYETTFSRLHFNEPLQPSSEDMLATLHLLKRACQTFDAWKAEHKVTFELPTSPPKFR
jgi:hypothetical protein